MKYIITIFISFCLIGRIYGQNEYGIDFKQESIPKGLKERVFNKIKKKQNSAEYTDIQWYPFYKFCFLTDSIENKSSYQFIKNSNLIGAYIESNPKKIYEFECENLGEVINKDVFDLIETAHSKTGQMAFVYFLENEKYWRDLLAIQKSGRIIFIDNQNREYENVEDLINYRYGSADKYKELIADEQERKEDLKKFKNIEEIKKIVKQDCRRHLDYYPQDTLYAVRSFVRDVKATAKISEDQKKLLIRLILRRIRLLDMNNKGYTLTSLFNEDLTQELITALTFNQFADFIKYGRYIVGFRNRAFVFLANHCYITKRMSKEEFERLMREEVFKREENDTSTLK